MSADNYAICPKCFARHESDVIAKKAELAEVYGKVTRNEYERMSADLAELKENGLEATLREDYEIVNDNAGTVTIKYGAACPWCGFSCEFEKVLELLKMKK
jgi:hypothetical protein